MSCTSIDRRQVRHPEPVWSGVPIGPEDGGTHPEVGLIAHARIAVMLCIDSFRPEFTRFTGVEETLGITFTPLLPTRQPMRPLSFAPSGAASLAVSGAALA